MKRLICTLFGLLAVLAFSQCARADEVDTVVQQEMTKHQIAGLVLTVIQDNHQIKTKGYGIANLEWNVPVAEDTVFEIGSITKQFTAACILMLAQDGKLSVDDKINDHLKVAPANWSGITIRHLLTHTSGLKNYTVLDGFELTKHMTQEQFIKRLAVEPVVFKPGDSWSYCNSGYSLLGYIIENASGQHYWDFIRARIFQPLGMNATTDRNPRVIVPHRAAGYEMKNGKPINRDYDLTDIFSAGAIVSTVMDMAKWNNALDGNTLLKDTSKAAWWTPTKLNNGMVKNYGFGWYVDQFEGHKNIRHSGSTSGFSSDIERFPDDHLAVITLSNADEQGVATVIGKEVSKLYLIKKKD